VDLAELLNSNGLVGQGVEVGVWRGDFSYWFRDRWQGEVLHLVDPWEKLNDYDDIRNTDFDPADYKYVLQRFARFGKRINMIRGLSVEAAKVLPDDLSFVYIDANHSYHHTLQDLTTWWPKIKPGGILAGHDLFSMTHPSVTGALVKFAQLADLEVKCIDGDYNDHGAMANAASYYMFKPC
jgi:hypothetical protein